MRPYEAMVIFDTGADEAAVNGVLDRALDALRAKGGNPGRVERWGRRTFAYELQHKREGYYVIIELTSEPPAVSDMERVLVLADEVLRHKVMRLPDKVAGRRAAAASSSRGGLKHGQRKQCDPGGNITRDPELRFTNTGQATSSFGLAVNRRWQIARPRSGRRSPRSSTWCAGGDGRECGREPGPRRPGDRHRSAGAAQLGDPRRGQAVQGRSGADEIGPSIRWATAQVTKNERRGPADGGKAPTSSGGGSKSGGSGGSGDAPGYGYSEEPF